MSLSNIIQQKDKHFQSMLNQFDREYQTLSVEAQKLIMSLFRNGDYTAESLAQTMSVHDDLINEWAIRNQEAIKFSKMMANEMGVKFAITKETVRNFDLIQGMNGDNLSKNVTSYIADIRRFGLQSKLEGRSFKDITKGLAGKFEELGRRLNTEAGTGIRMADRTVNMDFFKQAGIEKYIYFGPSDGKTRDACQDTLADSRQAEGWTMDQINNDNPYGTTFTDCGGFNCRHDWLPYVEGQ